MQGFRRNYQIVTVVMLALRVNTKFQPDQVHAKNARCMQHLVRALVPASALLDMKAKMGFVLRALSDGTKAVRRIPFASSVSSR